MSKVGPYWPDALQVSEGGRIGLSLACLTLPGGLCLPAGDAAWNGCWRRSPSREWLRSLGVSMWSRGRMGAPRAGSPMAPPPPCGELVKRWTAPLASCGSAWRRLRPSGGSWRASTAESSVSYVTSVACSHEWVQGGGGGMGRNVAIYDSTIPGMARGQRHGRPACKQPAR